MDTTELKHIIEAALLAAGRPLSLDELRGLFGKDDDAPPRQDLKKAVLQLQEEYAGRGIAVKEVASGFRIQVQPSMGPWLAKLWEARPPRYSRALMETLAIVAYRQPVTRGEIEEIRGVGVTSNIIRTLLERAWIRVVGHRDAPGRPEMFGTTREFLDYFGLKKLDELPTLPELKEMESLNVQLELPDTHTPGAEAAEGLSSASVASLDAARANAGENPPSQDDPDPEGDAEPEDPEDDAYSSATVVPLKSM